jgi:methylated-DNA-[protein]-cysteine S-methyltransferase
MHAPLSNAVIIAVSLTGRAALKSALSVASGIKSENGQRGRKNRIEVRSLQPNLQVMTVQHYHVFETACGFCGIAWSDAGISRFQLPSSTAEATTRNLLRRIPGAKPATPTAEVEQAVAAATRYFAGEKIDFSGFALDLDGQDDFFRQIYAAARRVGWGETTTYGALAKDLGITGWEGARDVGQAMAKNPVALIIPCHRVLAAGGKVGGFSAPGGSTTKLKMLELEHVHIGPGQQSLEL